MKSRGLFILLFLTNNFPGTISVMSILAKNPVLGGPSFSTMEPSGELNNWASGILSTDQCEKKQAGVQHWMTTWPGLHEQFDGFFVKRLGYTLNFSFAAGVGEEDGFAYYYDIRLREPEFKPRHPKVQQSNP